MADKGFLVENMLKNIGFRLNIPPFLKSAHQFDDIEARQTKEIARVRIHVERAIRRVKENHLFDSPIRLSMMGSLNQLWTIACLMTNFQGPLIVGDTCETSLVYDHQFEEDNCFVDVDVDIDA